MDMTRNKEMLRRMMERMEDTLRDFDIDFDESFASRMRGMAVDIEETDDQVIVRADLPGVEKDTIDVRAQERKLEIRARDDREVEEEGKNYYRRERSARRYNRTLTLPTPVDPDTADASFDNGVLTMELNKSQQGGGQSVDIS